MLATTKSNLFTKPLIRYLSVQNGNVIQTKCDTNSRKFNVNISKIIKIIVYRDPILKF